MIKYNIIRPSDHLKDFIFYFWILESDEAYTHYSMADAFPELLFHYGGQFEEIFQNGRNEKSFISGVHAQGSFPRQFHIDNSFGIFGVYLYPQAIPMLFNLSAKELTNQMPGLDDLLNNEGKALEDKILNAKSNCSRVKIIEEFIERKLSLNYKNALPVFDCIKFIIKNKETIKVNQLSKDYFLSERQFERQFQQFAGFNPKKFLRIVRFQSAMGWYGANNKSLTDIAYECGYYDQSHFIHDFKEFSGHHPKHYFSGNSDATKWRD